MTDDQSLQAAARDIAEQITAGWWDVPAIETREECVEALAALIWPILAKSESFALLSAQAKASHAAGRQSMAEELYGPRGRASLTTSALAASEARAQKAVILAELVRQAWRRDDEACMKLFGNNTTAILAREVESGL